ncbi:hypothetical protein [Neorhizobium galegae]|uniref:hypothetical protein n=1 Tax=Neorhizobium galegae TaxID=399 RepID=UPI00155E747C|nr:hypothetical protein [Neorhizobium galegae]
MASYLRAVSLIGLLSLFANLAQTEAVASDDMPAIAYPDIPAAVADRVALVPPGWHIETEVTGDLNGDRRPDLALVLQSDIPDVSFQGAPMVGPRMLVVGFAARQGFRPVVSHHRLIPRSNNPYLEDVFDPESGSLAINNGRLEITLRFFLTAGGWDRFTKTFSFAWNRTGFELARFDYDYDHRRTGLTRHWIADYRAGTLIYSTGKSSSDAPVKSSKSKLRGRSGSPSRTSATGWSSIHSASNCIAGECTHSGCTEPARTMAIATAPGALS